MPAGWAAAAAAVGGALISADASKSAANKQASAANQAAQTQAQMFNTINAQNAPQRDAGYQALSQIMYGLGAGPNPSTLNVGQNYSGSLVDMSSGQPRPIQSLYVNDPNYRKAWDSFQADHDNWEVAHGGAAGFTSNTPASVVEKAVRSNLPKDGTTQSLVGNSATMPADSTSGMQTGSNDIGGLFTHQFNAADLNANMAPNYAFVLDQGQRAAKNAGNLQTGLISGNTMKGLEDYTQGLAGNQYQQAFNNFTANQSNIFNRLATIAGFGTGANSVTANAGSNAAANIGSAQLAGGAAQAAGTVGQANALSGGLNNAASWYTLGNVMNNGGNTGGYDPNFTSDAAASMASSG